MGNEHVAHRLAHRPPRAAGTRRQQGVPGLYGNDRAARRRAEAEELAKAEAEAETHGALDARIDAVCVSGYFGPRENVWQEPIYRNVFGLLEQFGDAELAVREAASLTAVEALEKNVIDIVADDLNHLLQQLDGREIDVKGRNMVLSTEALVIERIQPDWRSKILSIITNPNIAYILMLVGIYGLILEFSNPGGLLPGIVGAISLLLALYAFQLLPINYAGLVLVIIGLVFIIERLITLSRAKVNTRKLIGTVITTVKTEGVHAAAE